MERLWPRCFFGINIHWVVDDGVQVYLGLQRRTRVFLGGDSSEVQRVFVSSP